MQPLGLGLVGAGAFGQFCLDAFAAMPEVKIVGITDVDIERAHALSERYDTQDYVSLEAMLENPALYVIALNTPPYLHAEQGLAALRAGKHLFCEKPLALTYEDGQQLVESAEENHVLLTIDYVMRLENIRYRRRYRNNSTGYKGVSPRGGRWHARIGLDGQMVHLGYFDDPQVAAQVYDAAARRLFADFAILNFAERPTPPPIEDLIEQIVTKLDRH